MTTVTAIIVNWNGAADTIACLESLQQVSRPGCDLSVVITDNASSDGSFAAIGQALTQRGYRAEPLAVPSDLSGRVSRGVRHVPGDDGPDITLVQTTDNLGFAGGNNVGVAMRAAAGRSDYFWFLNSDTLVGPGWLEHLRRVAYGPSPPGTAIGSVTPLSNVVVSDADGGYSFPFLLTSNTELDRFGQIGNAVPAMVTTGSPRSGCSSRSRGGHP